jgi:purine-binding chemotaxis protein CheW
MNITMDAKEEKKLDELATFYLGDTLLGIDALRVQEIIKDIGITPVHQANPYILGIINLRGRIVTVVDLKKKLDLPGSEATRVIIVDWDGEYVGFLVDSVSDIIHVANDAIGPPPSNMNEVLGGFLKGVYNTSRGLVALLDTDRVL